MFWLGEILSGIGFLLVFATLFKRLNLNKRQWFLCGSLLIGGLAIIAYGIIPPEEWDLSRHYELLAEMEQGGMKYVFEKSKYAHLPIINIFYALIAITGKYHLLPAITVVISYIFLIYIINDTVVLYGVDSFFVASAVLFNVAFCPYLHIVSGIRNALAFAFCAWIFYIDLMEKTNRMLVVCLYVCSIFIHPASIIIVGIRFVLPILRKRKWLNIILVIWSVLADAVVRVLKIVPISFLNDIGYKLYDYIHNQVFSGYKILFVKLFFAVSVLGLIEFYKKELNEKKMIRYIEGIESIILVIIGSFNVVFIADRLFFFWAFAAIPVLALIYKTCKGRIRGFFMIEAWCVVTLLYVHQFLYFSKDLL